MDILFLLIGLLCALLVPVFHFTLFGIKGVFFFFIMALFLSAVMAYMTLSIAKFFIAKLDFLRSNTIISWNLKEKTEKEGVFPSLWDQCGFRAPCRHLSLCSACRRYQYDLHHLGCGF